MSFYIDSDDLCYRNNNNLHELKNGEIGAAYIPHAAKKKIVKPSDKQEFITAHSNKFPGFSYEKIYIFVKSNNITLECPRCGLVSALPKKFLNASSGCPNCDKLASPKYLQKLSEKEIIRKQNLEKFIAAHKDRYPGKFKYTDIHHPDSKYTVICNIHGEIEVTKTSVNNKKGSGCLLCDNQHRNYFTLSRYLDENNLKLKQDTSPLEVIKLIREYNNLLTIDENVDQVFRKLTFKHFFRDKRYSHLIK